MTRDLATADCSSKAPSPAVLIQTRTGFCARLAALYCPSIFHAFVREACYERLHVGKPPAGGAPKFQRLRERIVLDRIFPRSAMPTREPETGDVVCMIISFVMQKGDRFVFWCRETFRAFSGEKCYGRSNEPGVAAACTLRDHCPHGRGSVPPSTRLRRPGMLSAHRVLTPCRKTSPINIETIW